ncbi:MAG: aminopeptidase [Candidatus Syntrophosphaera sp.]|nr:aminopeptidase [Candidatus Syntrophosphaera sp.]
MLHNYTDLISQLLEYKPSYDAQIKKLEAQAIPESLPLRDLFAETKSIALQGDKFGRLLEQDPEFKSISLAELAALNQEFFAPLEPETGYQNSLADPDHAVKLYGEGLGQLCSAIYTRFRNMRQYFTSQNYLQLDELLRLWFRLFELASQGQTEYEAWNQEVRLLQTENLKLKSLLQNLQRLSPDADYHARIIRTADLSDLRYLYRYGIHLSEHDFALAEFLSKYPEKDLAAIASFIVQSWVDGFTRAKKDHRLKRYANVIIPCGMERLGRLLIAELERIGMQPLVPLPHSKGINKQYAYDHRFDQALFLDREFVDQSLALAAEILEDLKDLISAQAGPVYVELFGETPFSPKAKSTALQLSPEQQQLWRELQAKNAQMYFQYYRRDEASFTIIAFPSPEIGAKFPEIFADTLRINLLDSKRYAMIQQNIINVLDTAEYVHVKGKPGNDTDIMVKMHTIKDPVHETNFENCVADVNIPVGEVFTSPVLKGSTGTLHVEDIYLGSLRYFNLRMHFEDGWVKDYSCTNFNDPAEGKKYIHQNLLLPHDTLPIGEFAIGTNTTAYQMARKYDILSLLPILIIEKMGPHFAIGDTCFSHEEDAPHPSFVNGKEMIAVENEKSATRKEDPVNAYTQKHMDITLPYEMLESISAITPEGKRIDIIRDGRFAVPGTQELNIPLDEGW